MKIKCPACPNEIEIDERLHHDDILRHFLSFPHESNPHHLIVVFAELVFKIHEKISEYADSDIADWSNTEVKNELKSLLEDEK